MACPICGIQSAGSNYCNVHLERRLEEVKAHIAERIAQDGVHNPRGCPYPMRAMCKYSRDIREFERRGLL